MALRQLFEVCRTRAAVTGKFPSDYREIEGLLSAEARRRLPTGVKFENPEAPLNRLRRQTPVGERVPCLRLPMGNERWLNVACTGWIYSSGAYWEEEFVELMPRPFMDPKVLEQDHRAIPDRAPPRSALCGVEQIDLVPSCNAMPTSPWFFGPTMGDKAPDFGVWLQSGVHEVEGRRFDVRGVLQVEGSLVAPGEGKRSSRSYPSQISGIQVNQEAKGLHLLAGTVQAAPRGATAAILRLHYSEGGEEEIPLVYGEHVSAPSDEAKGSRRLFPPPGNDGELYSLHYIVVSNPKPTKRIRSMDISSSNAPTHPFLLAVTVEK